MIRELRQKAGMTQKELAAKCGVVRQTISNIEIGTTRPSVKLAKKMADVFGVEWYIFFDQKVI